MLPLVVTLLFVTAVLAIAVYALVRPWTHVHYQHNNEKLWRPLD
jgi:hypothetical protein